MAIKWKTGKLVWLDKRLSRIEGDIVELRIVMNGVDRFAAKHPAERHFKEKSRDLLDRLNGDIGYMKRIVDLW